MSAPLTEESLRQALADLRRELAGEFEAVRSQIEEIPRTSLRRTQFRTTSYAEDCALPLRPSQCRSPACSFQLRPYTSPVLMDSEKPPPPAFGTSYAPMRVVDKTALINEGSENSSDAMHKEGSNKSVSWRKTQERMPRQSTFLQGNKRRSTWNFVTDKKLFEPEREESRGNQLAVCVHSARFEHFMGFLVLLNSLMVGFEADYASTHRGSVPDSLERGETIFCLIFSAELAMRLYADRGEFFTTGGLWNVFDAFLVLCQVLDQLNMYMFKALRLVRVLRTFRIVRALRMVHLFDELRSIVLSISSSLSSLAWAMALLAVNIYVFSVFFLQVVTNSDQLWRHESLRYWFDGLGRTILTMFECIGGGVSWDSVIHQVMKHVSGFMAIVFCFYIAMSIFAFMNLVTGLFVERVAVMVREDKDNTLTDCIEALFADTSYITEDVFRKELGSRAMVHFLKAIDVDSSEIGKLYSLIDPERKGSVEKLTVTNFCRRLLGPAKSLDIAILLQDVSLMLNLVQSLEQNLDG